MDKINELQVTQWDYKGAVPAETHIGPMAQDFQRVFGIGDGMSIAAMDKAGIALIGIQALSSNYEAIEKENAVLKEKLEEIEKVLATCCRSSQESSDFQKAALMQNQPNPFSQKTQIGYKLPAVFSKAIIRIFNSNGTNIQSINLEKGTSNVDFEGRTFSSGIYVYTLEIDGVTIETKQMIITKYCKRYFFQKAIRFTLMAFFMIYLKISKPIFFSIFFKRNIKTLQHNYLLHSILKTFLIYFF